MNNGEWYGVDFDGTLVTYDKNYKPLEFGEPIWPMIERVKKWLADGYDVRIFTARASVTGTTDRDVQAQIAHAIKYGENMTPEQAKERIEFWNSQKPDIVKAIKEWAVKYIGQELEVTDRKDFLMIELWDDRARRVIFNTGEVCCDN